jgi:quinol monooxygenase YgiN
MFSNAIRVKVKDMSWPRRATYSVARERRLERYRRSKWLAHSGKRVLVEVYRTAADPGKHKETAHYAKWRDTVAEMMAEPRSSVKYDNVYPTDEGWG